ncbi:MAG TPA: LysR family transcriptional regulator [Steroidobacteraceae bacterium]|jgi:DNA-binding transcriptional LysR family regulator|nr:LysR family transcriptional regulator [Steroidobacteraceae bacterium]
MTDKKRTAALDWEDVRFFTALAHHGTLAATARALKVTHATVSRRLASLEASLGHPLFTRNARGFTLNAAGASALAEAAQMEMAATALTEKRNTAGTVSGFVRVTIARVFADGFVAEQLAPLLAQYPALEVELIATSRNLSLARREAEIALRLARPVAGDLVARRVATLDYGFFASPEYAARLAGGERAAFIAFDDASEYVPEAAWAKRFLAGKRVSLRANSQGAQAEAARGGAGMALLPGLLARARQGLVQVPFDETPPARELWLLMRPDVARLARVRVVADHLVAMFEESIQGVCS